MNLIITGSGLGILVKEGYRPYQPNSKLVNAFMGMIIGLYSTDVYRTVRGNQVARYKVYTVIHHLIIISNAIQAYLSGYWGLEGIRYGSVDGNLYEIGRNGQIVLQKFKTLFKVLTAYGFISRAKLDRLYPSLQLESPRPMPVSFKVTQYMNRVLIMLIILEKIIKWSKMFRASNLLHQITTGPIFRRLIRR